MSRKALVIWAGIIGGAGFTFANGFPKHDPNSWLGFAAFWCLAISLIAATTRD